ncbi:unnamed protein product [Blepharisma stoltei]|uniref:Transmembrane protein n=1 Tax=Blepharisma stoltei TaxID=1481888 RepID=A0AAU9IL46_9CILI|nr:unnamed protein product [Blepharisma stoltei]
MINLANKPLTILPLQTLLYFDWLYSAWYFAVATMIYIYKGSYLIYPYNTIAPEYAGLCFFAVLQFFRIFVGSVANKSEGISAVLWFLALSIPAILASIFYIALQTFVFNADVVTNAILLFFQVTEAIFGFLMFIKFKKAPPRGKAPF